MIADTAHFAFSELSKSDLVVGGIYEGGQDNLVWSDPISRIFPCGNQGGIRSVRVNGVVRSVILHSLQNDEAMPDTVDQKKRIVRFFGDNRRIDRDIFGNPKGGNRLLQDIFKRAYGSVEKIRSVPPTFVFTRAREFGTRAVRFQGVAVPGSDSLSMDDALAQVHFATEVGDFDNYCGTFTLLGVERVSRAWLSELFQGELFGNNCPLGWKDWAKNSLDRTSPCGKTPKLIRTVATTPSASPVSPALLQSAPARSSTNLR